MQEGRVIMDKISPRMMRALQKTGEHISGYIDRKDMIAFQIVSLNKKKVFL